MYLKEDNLVKLLGFFSIVSLVLCCMGLFATFSLHVLQKTREMSIRKVLGANSIDLLKAITRNYITITLLAIGIAIPIGWLLMSNWLSEFSYRIQMDASVFILTASIVLSASFITFVYHVIRIVRVNPVDSLKYE